MLDYLSFLIKPTTLCNASCTYCYQSVTEDGSREIDRAKSMSPLTLERVLGEIKKVPSRNLVLQWIGGETLLPGVDFFKKVDELLYDEALQPERVVNYVQTNGILLDSRWACFFKERASRWRLSISYDCFETLYQGSQSSLVRGALMHAKITENIALMIQSGVDVGILVTIEDRALKIPAETWVEDWRAKCLRWVGLQLCYDKVYSHRASDDWRPYLLFLDQIFDEQLKHNVQDESHPIFLRESLYLLYQMTDVQHCSGAMLTSCHYNPQLCSSYLLSIDTEGNLFSTCDAFAGLVTDSVWRYYIGNITEASFMDLFQSSRLDNFQSRCRELRRQCRNCRIWQYCRGGCPVFKSTDHCITTFRPDSCYCQFTQGYFSYVTVPEKAAKIRRIYGSLYHNPTS
jgi:uncharacterized protein